MSHSILLLDGSSTWVSDFDYDGLSMFTWQRDDLGFVMRWRPIEGILQPLYMHRIIVGAWPDESVRHRDGNKLNNRFHNLHLQKQS